MKFNTMLRSEMDACGQVLGWWFEISDAETYHVVYESGGYENLDDAYESMEHVLKKLGNAETENG